MRILILGQGGREHALVRALRRSSSPPDLHCLPGNPGIKGEATCYPNHGLSPRDVLAFCQQNPMDLVIVGPEQPLVEGVYDLLRESKIPVVGCSRASAQLEGSKVFSKNFMTRAQVPTAFAVVVRSAADVLENLKKFTPPYVLKADGLAGGKGVFIADTREDLIIAAKRIFEDRTLGASGDVALLEQFQSGYELSVFVLTNGKDYKILPLAQDHKRLLDGQRGPNTGGMGTVAPMKIAPELLNQIEDQIVRPSVDRLAQENLEYRGVLFIGIMVTPEGPSVLEYNVRWGDPEAQVILPLLASDGVQVFDSLARGELADLEWTTDFATCVVLAAPGYPDAPEKGLPITLSGETSFEPNGYLLHAGTTQSSSGQWMIHGGRVLNAVGLGKSLLESRDLAYRVSQCATWEGQQKRLDIGQMNG